MLARGLLHFENGVWMGGLKGAIGWVHLLVQYNVQYLLVPSSRELSSGRPKNAK